MNLWDNTKDFELVKIDGVYCPKGTLDYRGTLENYTWEKPLQNTTKVSSEELSYGNTNTFSLNFLDDDEFKNEVLEFTEDNWGFQVDVIHTGKPSHAHLFVNMNDQIYTVCKWVRTMIHNRAMKIPSPTLISFLTVWDIDKETYSKTLVGKLNVDALHTLAVSLEDYQAFPTDETAMIYGRLAQIIASFRRTNETG